ncbi:MAG: glycine cleavage T C-terminal barrel domain-containing protein, partial [Victivallaceae bacterium]
DREFIGKAALVSEPVEKKLVAIALDGRRATRHGAEVCDESGRQIGVVTSGAFAPSLETAVAMAYVRTDHCPESGRPILLTAGKGLIPGVVAELPFYKTSSVRKKL